MSKQHENRLSRETSPYLLQHQHNPVDWYPWGPEAFEAARAQDKPIFLSVGYSTCYWCHVMERQSFENEAVAAEMNQRFINIKVDREERPDVDQLYMTAVQVLTKHGGWPMSVFLLPDLRPFYGGTYFPPTDAHGRPGFVTILRAIEDAYRNRRDDVTQSATQLADILQQLAEPQPAERAFTIDQKLIDFLIQRSTADYDRVHGGFGAAPKFPRETLIELLLVHHGHSRDEKIAKMLRHTLDAMADGGIRDQIGGAFHRYSTDAQWLVPHFEIMLYDNAMLGWIYAEASQQFGEPKYAQVAREIFWFVNEEMTSPDGAFYTALDAEVDAMEGGSYLWKPEQVAEVLGKEDATIFNRAYGLDQGPNFADPHGESHVPDHNVLFRVPNVAIDESRLREMRAKLYQARRKRKQPLLDTKIITSWNAMMIRALAHAGKVLDEPQYIERANRAADYLLKQHRRDDGTLYRASREGQAKYDAFLDDYAFLAQALVALGRNGDARSIVATMRSKFGADNGGFYFTAKGADDLIVRQMIATDSPLPSGVAIAADVLLSLGDRDAARRAMEVFAGQLQQNAESMSSLLQVVEQDVREHGPIEVSAGVARDRPTSPQKLASDIVNIAARWDSPTTLHVTVHVRDGFHVNSNIAGDQMIATTLDVMNEIARVEYPPGEVYEGEATIVVHFDHPRAKPDAEKLRLTLRYQACDENSCLPPVTKQFEIRNEMRNER